MEYVKHSDSSFLVEPKIFSTKTGIVHGNLDKVRPFTLHGFCNFVGIHPGTWDGWKKEDREEFFASVQLQIESIIYDQQYQGAVANIFNVTMVSRKLGLADKSEFSGPGGKPIQVDGMTARERVASKLLSLSSRESAFNDPVGDDGE